MDPYAEAARVVRDQDRDRYLADLFVPQPARRHILALHAFNAEIASVRDKIREPMAGEVRLQWWRDALARRESGGNPVATALLETMAAFSLPVQALDRMIEARIFDLYEDPMPDMASLEGYAGDTASALFQLAAIVLNEGKATDTADLAGHAGVAWTMAAVLRSLPVHVARRQMYLPKATIEARKGELDDYYAGRPTGQLGGVLYDVSHAARTHLRAATELLPAVPGHILPAFVLLGLAQPYLESVKGAGATVLTRVPDIPQWRRQMTLWGYARRLSRLNRKSGRGG
ncbi:MAG: squalene/phytoene synthase family protein [Bauldia sp.]|nr:squalene/phytoene synthase family protein [Bauldia sp.]